MKPLGGLVLVKLAVILACQTQSTNHQHLRFANIEKSSLPAMWLDVCDGLVKSWEDGLLTHPRNFRYLKYLLLICVKSVSNYTNPKSGIITISAKKIVGWKSVMLQTAKSFLVNLLTLQVKM